MDQRIDQQPTQSGLTRIGTEREVDALVFGTGLRAAEMPMARRIRGRGGQLLAHDWRDGGAQAYLGTTVAGYPNLFLLTGPNSALAHNSVLLGIESQVRYVLDALRLMRSQRLAAVEVQPQAQQAFVQRVRDRVAATVWVADGCHSWLLDHAGRNTTIWPWSNTAVWMQNAVIGPRITAFCIQNAILGLPVDTRKARSSSRYSKSKVGRCVRVSPPWRPGWHNSPRCPRSQGRRATVADRRQSIAVNTVEVAVTCVNLHWWVSPRRPYIE